MQGTQQRGHAKFEEYKPCDDERALMDSLKTFKSIKYAFEVDGQVVINTNDSYSTQPDIACQNHISTIVQKTLVVQLSQKWFSFKESIS